MTVTQLLRRRLLLDPSQETIDQLCMELADSMDWLKTIGKMKPGLRKAILNLSTLINVEGDESHIHEIANDDMMKEELT
jgi:hypothetical protein